MKLLRRATLLGLAAIVATGAPAFGQTPAADSGQRW
jgi:hypothetical protein